MRHAGINVLRIFCCFWYILPNAPEWLRIETASRWRCSSCRTYGPGYAKKKENFDLGSCVQLLLCEYCLYTRSLYLLVNINDTTFVFIAIIVLDGATMIPPPKQRYGTAQMHALKSNYRMFSRFISRFTAWRWGTWRTIQCCTDWFPASWASSLDFRS